MKASDNNRIKWDTDTDRMHFTDCETLTNTLSLRY